MPYLSSCENQPLDMIWRTRALALIVSRTPLFRCELKHTNNIVLCIMLLFRSLPSRKSVQRLSFALRCDMSFDSKQYFSLSFPLSVLCVSVLICDFFKIASVRYHSFSRSLSVSLDCNSIQKSQSKPQLVSMHIFSFFSMCTRAFSHSQ